MARILTCFLSCSEHEEDHEVVTFFENLINAFGITPYRAMKEGESRPPVDKIREQIEQKDCLIAVATRRDKIAKKNAWRTATFIEQEIGMAFEKRKPIMAFFESGVEGSGIIPHIMDYAGFDKAKLLESTPDIAKRLSKLKDRLLEEQTLLITSDHINEEIINVLKIDLDGHWVDITEIKVSCVADRLASVEHERFLPPGSGDFEMKDYKFKFYPIFHEGDGEIKDIERSRGPKAILWAANFDPPLEQNQKAKYGYCHEGYGTYPLTLEKVSAMIERGEYFPFGIKEPFAEEGWVIRARTKRLSFSIEFPEGYKIGRPMFKVRLGLTSHEEDEEERRLKRSRSFEPEYFANRWCLTLNIKNPHIGLYYQILWMPSNSEEYKKLQKKG